VDPDLDLTYYRGISGGKLTSTRYSYEIHQDNKKHENTKDVESSTKKLQQ
jgi:hypothetical protein